MKTKSVISMVIVLLLVTITAFAFNEDKLTMHDAQLLAPISGIVYQHGSCNTVPQAGAYFEVYDATTLTLLCSGYTDSNGNYGCSAQVGHSIKVKAIYNNKIGCINFIQPKSGNENAHVCINMNGTVCQNED